MPSSGAKLPGGAQRDRAGARRGSARDPGAATPPSDAPPSAASGRVGSGTVGREPTELDAVAIHVQHLFGFPAVPSGVVTVDDVGAHGRRPTRVHVFEHVSGGRTCYAWFDGDDETGEIVVVLRTEAIASPAEALRAFRRHEVASATPPAVR